MFLHCDHKGHRALCNLASWKTFSRFVWLFWLGISIMLYLLIVGIFVCHGVLCPRSPALLYIIERLGNFAESMPPGFLLQETGGRGNPVYFLSLLLPPSTAVSFTWITSNPPYLWPSSSGCSQLSLVTSPWVSSPSFLCYKSPVFNSSVIHTLTHWLLTDLPPSFRDSHLDAFPGYVDSQAPKNRCFWIMVLEKTVESPLDCKEIQPVHPKGHQSWIFIERTGAEAETPILWPPDAENWFIGKDPHVGKIEGSSRRGQ